MASIGPTFSLALHADYGCRSTGACCSSNWSIPVENTVLARIGRALTEQSLSLEYTAHRGRSRASALVPAEILPEGAEALLGRDESRCVFLETQRGNLCAIHRQLGQTALPVACRQFPRVCVLEPRGVRISLSHYCPTAAQMLFREDASLDIVRSPEAFPDAAGYEGLDVREALPPPLHAKVLMDYDGLEAWESGVLALWSQVGISPERGLAVLRDAALRACRWRPGVEPLASHVQRALREANCRQTSTVTETRPWTAAIRTHDDVCACVPRDWRPRESMPLRESFARFVAPVWPAFTRPICRYLAARSFANWTLQMGGGVLGHVASIAGAHDVLVVEAARLCELEQGAVNAARLLEAFRRADHLLLHLARHDAVASLFAVAGRATAPKRPHRER